MQAVLINSSALIQLVSQLSILLIGTLLVFIGFSPQNIISVMTIAILVATKIIPQLTN